MYRLTAIWSWFFFLPLPSIITPVLFKVIVGDHKLVWTWERDRVVRRDNKWSRKRFLLTFYIFWCIFGEGNGTPLQYSCLENPMDGGAWWAAVHGVSKSRTRLSNFTLTFHFHTLEKEMATHSSVLAWRILGMGEPGGLPSMGSHRVGHDWSDLAAAAAAVHFNLLGSFTPFSWLIPYNHIA